MSPLIWEIWALLSRVMFFKCSAVASVSLIRGFNSSTSALASLRKNSLWAENCEIDFSAVSAAVWHCATSCAELSLSLLRLVEKQSFKASLILEKSSAFVSRVCFKTIVCWDICEAAAVNSWICFCKACEIMPTIRPLFFESKTLLTSFSVCAD